MGNIGATDRFRLNLGHLKVMLGAEYGVTSLRVAVRLDGV